ncbi:alpha/beta fold hydrolase [Portibacter marinus]|uniref:alpha/beta fold hydrolase n=1 Tax=Portibacter marinus TaxID=2898660 RepID=UPI001F443544|nr:alpha/beta fold hydrolase [Portibacter marinus]
MKLNHKILGEGDPIVILHGLFGMLDNWQSVAKVLAENYMVILVDLRNHGKSPHSDEWNIPLMAGDVLSFMEDNWIHQATVMGHSMGGKVAMEMALSFPDIVDHLIVVDIGPKQYEPGHDNIFDALQSVDVSLLNSRTDADEALSLKLTDWGVRQFLLKNIGRIKEGGYQWKMNLPSIIENYPEILKAVKADSQYSGPALFIRGALSNYIMPDDYKEITRIFPKARIETIEDAGHWVHADKKEELINLVKNFLGQ